MVTILKYVLLGILLYIFVIPIIEELATVIIQALEVLKGKCILHLSYIQAKVPKPTDDEVKSHAIGFTLPDEEEYEEEDEEND